MTFKLLMYIFHFILTAKLLEKQIERERARKADEVSGIDTFFQ